MPADQKRIFSPNAVTICMDVVEGGREKGRMYHNYRETPVSFNSVWELLGHMEAFYETLQYPQASMEYRSFANKHSYRTGGGTEGLKQREPVRENGKRGTFVVRVQYRQNATWQGQVTWTERQVTKSFRSALEMLKLIDSALDEGEAGCGAEKTGG